jgi:hypothetical protein
MDRPPNDLFSLLKSYVNLLFLKFSRLKKQKKKKSSLSTFLYKFTTQS